MEIASQGDRILRRIDRIYAPLPSAWMNFEVSSKVIPSYSLSDHLPVLAKCKSACIKKFPSGYRMNIGQLEIPAYRCKLTNLLKKERAKMALKSLCSQGTLFHCVLQSMRYGRAWGKKHAHLKRKAEFDLRNELAKARLDLQEAL
jgi:hypothetical protein